MARNKPRKQGKKVSLPPEVKITEITDSRQLPDWYIGFPDDVEAAMLRLSQLEERLIHRGLKVVRPLNVYRYTVLENHYGKDRVVKREKPYSMLAIELQRI